MSEILFDQQLDYKELTPHLKKTAATEATQDLSEREFHVCTVRQKTMGDISIGNVFWLLQALKAKQMGAKVVVTDFYDTRGSDNTGVVEFMNCIRLLDQKGTDESVDLRRAEDVEKDPALWKTFCDYVRANTERQDEWEIIGESVREGIDEVIAGAEYTVPPSLERLFEELAVWVDGIDKPGVIQLLNHEEETTAWVRRLFASAQKKFWQIAVPFVNEYRGIENVPREIDGKRSTLKIRLRLKDLYKKLAGADRDSEEEERFEFYEQLFSYFVEALEKGIVVYEESGVEPDVAEEITRYLKKIDPRLIPFLLFHHMPNEEHREWFRRDLELVGRQLGESLSEIAKTELKGPNPSLRKLAQIAPALPTNSFLDKSLVTTLLDDRFDIDELCDLWINLIPPRELGTQNLSPWGHPIMTKLAKDPNLSDTKWKALKEVCYQALTVKDVWPPKIKDLVSIPIVQRILKELQDTEPEKLFTCLQVKMQYYFEACDTLPLKEDWLCDGPNPDGKAKKYMRAIAEMYLASGHSTHDVSVRRYLHIIQEFGNQQDRSY